MKRKKCLNFFVRSKKDTEKTPKYMPKCHLGGQFNRKPYAARTFLNKNLIVAIVCCFLILISGFVFFFFCYEKPSQYVDAKELGITLRFQNVYGMAGLNQLGANFSGTVYIGDRNQDMKRSQDFSIARTGTAQDYRYNLEDHAFGYYRYLKFSDIASSTYSVSWQGGHKDIFGSVTAAEIRADGTIHMTDSHGNTNVTDIFSNLLNTNWASDAGSISGGTAYTIDIYHAIQFYADMQEGVDAALFNNAEPDQEALVLAAVLATGLINYYSYDGNAKINALTSQEGWDQLYDGLIFKGFYNRSSGGTKVVDENFNWVWNKSSVYPCQLYAQWDRKSYTLTANANGGSIPATSGWSGSGSTATKSVEFESTYGSLPTPTRSGYTFEGWYTAASGGELISQSTKMPSENTTIYAHWTQNLVLTADANGGTFASVPSGWTKGDGVATKQYSPNTNFGTLPTPTKPGTYFDGWYTDLTGGTKVTSSTKITANTTIYARYLETWADHRSSDLEMEDGEFLISSAEDLGFLIYQVANNSSSYMQASYRQTADIDLSAYYWHPIGTATNLFKGSYNGNGRTISGIKSPSATNIYMGLFGAIDGATIQNVRLADVNLASDNSLGGIAGIANTNSVISNCEVVSGSLNGEATGGIAGENYGVIKECINNASVTSSGGYCVGGIAGSNEYVIELCVNTGQIQSDSHTGGIAGESTGDVIKCFSSGLISGGDASFVGGIVGGMSGSTNVVQCASNSLIVGGIILGGIVGICEDECYIQQCSFVGNIIIDNQYQAIAGGLVGGVAGEIAQIDLCFVKANIINSGQDLLTLAIGSMIGVVNTSNGIDATRISRCGAVISTNSEQMSVNSDQIKIGAFNSPVDYGDISGVDIPVEASYSIIINANDPDGDYVSVNYAIPQQNNFDMCFGFNPNKTNYEQIDGDATIIPLIEIGVPVPLGCYAFAQFHAQDEATIIERLQQIADYFGVSLNEIDGNF